MAVRLDCVYLGLHETGSRRVRARASFRTGKLALLGAPLFFRVARRIPVAERFRVGGYGYPYARPMAPPTLLAKVPRVDRGRADGVGVRQGDGALPGRAAGGTLAGVRAGSS